MLTDFSERPSTTPTRCSFWSTSFSIEELRVKSSQDTEYLSVKPTSCERANELTLITYGAFTHTAMEVVDEFGNSVEVIDLRTLNPLDEETILASVRKTSKVLIFHEATLTAGPGAELAARISEKAFEYLDGPPSRLAPPDSPVPFAPSLEKAWLPGVEELRAKIRDLLNY